MTARTLTSVLRNHDIEVLDFAEKNEHTDADVELPGCCGVHLCRGNFILYQLVEDDRAVWPLGTYNTVNELIAAIKNLSRSKS